MMIPRVRSFEEYPTMNVVAITFQVNPVSLLTSCNVNSILRKTLDMLFPIKELTL